MTRKAVRSPESEARGHKSSDEWIVARAEGTINAARQPENSHLVPGVEKNDAEAGEVLDVSRHEGKATFEDPNAFRRN